MKKLNITAYVPYGSALRKVLSNSVNHFPLKIEKKTCHSNGRQFESVKQSNKSGPIFGIQSQG